MAVDNEFLSLADQVHPDDKLDPAMPPRARRQVRVNVKESVLQWLHHRGLINETQWAAGEKLRWDFERAQLGPQVTMRWDATPAARRRGMAAAMTQSEAAIAAKARFHAALAAAGPGLADICWRVICANEAMTAAEKALGWPTRSGRLVLTLALDRLAVYYGTGS